MRHGPRRKQWNLSSDLNKRGRSRNLLVMFFAIEAVLFWHFTLDLDDKTLAHLR